MKLFSYKTALSLIVDNVKYTNFLSQIVTISTRYFDKEFLWRFFREEVEQMRNAVFIEDWLEEKLQEGIVLGRREGACWSQTRF